MTVVGFNLSKISIERKDVISGKIEIKSKADITGVKKEELKLAPDKDVLRFDFDFLIEYTPEDLANVHFKGHVLVLEDPKNVKKILKDWKKKNVEPQLKEAIFNVILRKCNIKALVLEEDINLPTHLPFPKVKAE